MIDWLRNEWKTLVSLYTKDDAVISEYWEDIENHYTSKNRYYHNLSHIYNMLQQAHSLKATIVDYNTFRFAIWYHDIIYNATKKNNETKSAEFSEKRLKSLNFDQKSLKIVNQLIKSTQKHDILLNTTSDNAYLLDMDLSILGTDWNLYEAYTQNIRKEYAIYPDFIYKKGRKKAMLHFLERPTIYFTEYYQNKYEEQARINLKKEISLL
ncbi:hypothetical protein [Psychroserpens algicola]|uniref:Metal-dependent HD superfamily phosphohydrolase n=1 Tax=Psychroserpens algicola TaxID=1719034 RepID=A0ABT0H8A3_9FLAO|nr:hypothetical protein [Psychroserpens algicola]MCK8480264.1 hypothetical protein [Psychroserpens algicola]